MGKVTRKCTSHVWAVRVPPHADPQACAWRPSGVHASWGSVMVVPLRNFYWGNTGNANSTAWKWVSIMFKTMKELRGRGTKEVLEMARELRGGDSLLLGSEIRPGGEDERIQVAGQPLWRQCVSWKVEMSLGNWSRRDSGHTGDVMVIISKCIWFLSRYDRINFLFTATRLAVMADFLWHNGCLRRLSRSYFLILLSPCVLGTLCHRLAQEPPFVQRSHVGWSDHPGVWCAEEVQKGEAGALGVTPGPVAD